MCSSKRDVPHPNSHHTHHVVFSPVWLSVLVCVSWPLASAECHFSTVTSPRCPSHLKPCPHSISSLHLFAPRCILVIFCVVCFGSSSVSRHSHLMAGCSLAHRCCFSHCQSLAPQIHSHAPPQAVQLMHKWLQYFTCCSFTYIGKHCSGGSQCGAQGNCFLCYTKPLLHCTSLYSILEVYKRVVFHSHQCSSNSAQQHSSSEY